MKERKVERKVQFFMENIQKVIFLESKFSGDFFNLKKKMPFDWNSVKMYSKTQNNVMKKILNMRRK